MPIHENVKKDIVIWDRSNVKIEIVPDDINPSSVGSAYESHYYNPALVQLANELSIQRNGVVATLEGVEKDAEGNLVIALGVTTFKYHRASIGVGLTLEQQTLYEEARAIAEVTGENLAQGIAVSAKLITSDGIEVVSKRNTDNRIGTIGGVFNPDELLEFFGPEYAFDPFALIVLELHEELGIWNEFLNKNNTPEQNVEGLHKIFESNPIMLSDIINRSHPTNVPLIVFDVRLNISFEELQSLFAQRTNDELQSLMPVEEAPHLINGTKPTAAVAAIYPQYFKSVDNPTSAISPNGYCNLEG